MSFKVDVAINVFGKVHQTALSLLSLMECSSEHIDRIYFQEEPFTAEYEFKKHDKILEYFSHKIKHYVPKYWNGIDPTDVERAASSDDYRLSIRYQYGWEKSRQRYLLTVHNDIEVTTDIIANLYDELDGNTGVGGNRSVLVVSRWSKRSLRF